MRVIEVFADVLCPFTHVGLRRLIERRAQLGRDDVILRVRSWPLELVNEAPLTGDFVAAEIGALRVAAAPNLFAGFDATRFPVTSLPALALAASAYCRNDQRGEQVSLALRTALFEEGRNIGEQSELAAIAAAIGVPIPGPEATQTVHDDWHEGERRGVVGSPHFFVEDHGFFCPTLDIQRVDGHFQVTVDADAADAFLDQCFA